MFDSILEKFLFYTKPLRYFLKNIEMYGQWNKFRGGSNAERGGYRGGRGGGRGGRGGGYFGGPPKQPLVRTGSNASVVALEEDWVKIPTGVFYEGISVRGGSVFLDRTAMMEKLRIARKGPKMVPQLVRNAGEGNH